MANRSYFDEFEDYTHATPATTNKDFDYFSGFEDYESPKQKPQRTPLQKAGRLGAQGLIGAFSSATLPYELATRGQEEPFLREREQLFEELEELGKKSRKGTITPTERQRMQQLKELSLSPEQMEQPPQDVGLRPILEKISGADLTPEGTAERAVNILGGLKGFGVKGIVSPLATSTAMGYLEEKQLPLPVSLGGGILADILTRSSSGLLKKTFGIATKGYAKETGKAASEILRIQPEQVKKDVIDAASRLGIQELPLSAQISNPFVRGLEARVRGSSLAGEQLGQQLERTGERLTQRYESIADQLSSRRDLLPGAVAEESVDALRRIEELGAEKYRSLYTAAEKALPKGATISPRMGIAINKVIDSTLRKLQSSALGSPAKDALYKRLQRLQNSWAGTNNIPVESLLELKRDLGDVIKFEVRGGYDKLLNPLLGTTRNAVLDYGRSENPVFLNKWKEAEKTFGAHAETFRKNPLFTSLLKGSRPETILPRMKTIKGIREMQAVFGKTPEGTEAFNALKRYTLEDLLGQKLIDKKGNISWGNASAMFKKPKTRELAKELVGQKNFETLKDIVRVSSGIEEGLKKFLNTSQTASAHFDIALMVALPAKILKHLVTGHPIKAGGAAIGLFSPKILANLMSNPEFVTAMRETALAGRGSNAEKFLSAAKRVATITTSAMLQGEDESKVE